MEITYECSCGAVEPLEGHLFFCPGCKALRCRQCLTPEIVGYFCPNCLVGMKSQESLLFTKQCSKCFICPCCQNFLTISVGQDPVAALKGEKQSISYLLCQHCLWNSRHLSAFSAPTHDTMIASNINRERDLKTATLVRKFAELLNLKASLDKPQVGSVSGRSSLQGSSFPSIHKGSGSIFHEKEQAQSTKQAIQQAEAQIEEAMAADWCDSQDQAAAAHEPSLRSAMAKGPHHLEIVSGEIAALKQRFADTEQQHHLRKDCCPVRVPLKTKRTLACPQCTKKLFVPDPQPTSSKVQTKLMARSSVPRLTFTTPLQLPYRVCSLITFCLANLLVQPVKVKIEWAKSPDQSVEGSFVLDTALGAYDSLQEIQGLGEAGETFDPKYKEIIEGDDPSVVRWRAANKIYFSLKVTPVSAVCDAKFRLRVTVSALTADAPDAVYYMNVNLGKAVLENKTA